MSPLLAATGKLWLSYLWQGYRDNEHEVQAREAAARTRHID